MVEHAEVAAHRIFLESKIKSIAMQKEVIKRLRDRIEKHTEEALAFEEELQQKKWLLSTVIALKISTSVDYKTKN